MDREIIRRWNERVEPEDTVIHLGDFMFGGSASKGTKKKPEYYLEQLNGNLVLIRGNHDNNNGVKTNIESLQLILGGIGWWCQHKPEMLTWAYNLCGHVHDLWLGWKVGGRRIINMSVEMWKYYPVNIEEILAVVSRLEQSSEQKIYR